MLEDTAAKPIHIAGTHGFSSVQQRENPWVPTMADSSIQNMGKKTFYLLCKPSLENYSRIHV